MRSVTPLFRPTSRFIEDVMAIHHRRIKNSRRLQAMFFFEGAFHRVDVESARGMRWFAEREDSLMGVYRRSVDLEQLIDDATVMIDAARREEPT